MKLHKLILAVSLVMYAVVVMGNGYSHLTANPHQITVSQSATMAAGGTTDPGYPDASPIT